METFFFQYDAKTLIRFIIPFSFDKHGTAQIIVRCVFTWMGLDEEDVRG